MSATDDQTARRTLLEQLESESFSGVVAVTFEGRPLIEFAAGLANRETGQANRLETRFATASVSKMFTATCVARLADAGKCGFEQPFVEIVRWLGRHFDARMSLASLLSHRSGLGDYLDDEADLPFAGMDVAKMDCPRAFLPYILQAPRGTAGEFHYSSAGYVLLGLAIEEIVGMPFTEAMAAWVIAPAGLRATGFPAMDLPSADLAVGYLKDGRPNRGHLPRTGGADGGIVTTAEDMRRFFGCLKSEGFLSEVARQFLWREVSRINASESYGHGFYLVKIRDEWWPGHTGSDPGVSARVALSPASESSIVVFCNRDGVAFRVFRLAADYLNAIRKTGA